MKSDNWTEQELAIMQKYYYTKGPSGCAHLLPGRTVEAIQRKASKMGLKVSLETRRAMSARIAAEQESRWTPEEDAILLRLYKKVTYAEMCRELPGRTAGAISLRAHNLGIKSSGSSWSEEDDQILREHYHKGLAHVMKLLPGRKKSTICSRARKLGLRGSRAEKEIPWTEEEVALLRQYYPRGLKVCMKKFPYRTEASVSGKARKLGIVIDKEPIVIDGVEYQSVRQVLLKYGLPANRIYALAREHSVSVVEATKRCALGEWDGRPTCKQVTVTGSFGALGELKVKSILSSFPGMVLCACARCKSVHLIPETEMGSFRCGVNGEETLYPEFCVIPYQLRKSAKREGVLLKNPTTQRYKL